MHRTPEEHHAAVRDLVSRFAPVARVETVSASNALGRTLAEDFRALCDSPPFDNSQMDGYALPTTEAQTWVTGPTVAAGNDPDVLYPSGLAGRAAPVMTGAKLPKGTAAVVPVEVCSPDSFVAEGDVVAVPPSTSGQFVRRTGSDTVVGSLIAPAGTVITPVLLGVLAAQGVSEVTVQSRARILIVSGGKEIGGSGAVTIPDSNGPVLEALAARAGIEVVGRIRTNDEAADLLRDVRQAVEKRAPTAIVTSGGISQGQFEVVRQAFADGWYGHVAQQPGGPQGLSVFNTGQRSIPVISLPGNPISTLVSFRLYVAPILGYAQMPMWVPMADALPGLEGREQFLRGRIVDGRGVVVGGTGSHLLHQAAEAECLIRVPADCRIEAEELALVYPL